MSLDYRRAANRAAMTRACRTRPSGGGKLNVPRTPVEKIMLGAKRLKQKREFLERQGLA